MFILGVILSLLAVAAAVGVFIDNGAAAPLSVFGFSIGGTTVAAVFLAGIVVTAMFFFGLSLMGGSARRTSRRSRELKRNRRREAEHRTTTTELEREKARLQDQLARERRERGTPAG